jgi:hypothetical protein
MRDTVFTRIEVHWGHTGPVVYVFGRAQALRISFCPEWGAVWLVGSPPSGPAYASIRAALEAGLKEAAWSGIPLGKPIRHRTLRRGTVAEAASTAQRLVRRLGVQ